MNKMILITRPSHDEIVSYLFHWGQEILQFAKDNAVRSHDLSKEKANRNDVESFVASMKPGLIVLQGHGDTNNICGHKDEPIVTLGENENILKSCITYAIACDSAGALGKKVVEDKNTTFIGYEGSFGFIRDATRECNPPKDKYAKPFQEISNLISKEMIRGKTAKEAYEKSQQRCRELIKEYSASDADPANKEIRFWLFWDMQFQRVLGEQNAKL